MYKINIELMKDINMEHICFCPGKIITGKHSNWYLPYNDKNSTKIYCEHCFNEYSYCMNELQFLCVKSREYSCSNDKDFNESCIINNNIRVSIVNPTNYYRYKKIRSTTSTAMIGLPNSAEYIIVIENYDKTTCKITVNDIFHDNIENTYYDKLYNRDNFHIIDQMSHNEPLIFNEQNKNIITLKVNKWKKHFDNGSNYLVMNGEPITFNIKLVKNDNAVREMESSSEYYKSLKEQNKKIVIVNDFV
jgi:hypothetical protein